MINFCLFLLLFTACICQPDLDAIKKRLKKNPIDIEAIRRAQTVDDSKMAHLLIVDYWFRTETIIYDVGENKENASSIVIAGNFSFETLHHDNEGGMLGKLTLTLCKTDNCGSPPPIFLSFRQGGNNILEAASLLEPDEMASWNFLYAIANTIYTPAEYGEGDTQRVDTAYGRCRIQFGRPENKRFRRVIDSCELGNDRNFSRFEGIDIVEYNQDAWYTQNTKVDADIIMIDAVEWISFKSAFHEKHGFIVESRTHVEITNRTRLYIPKHCESEIVAADCAKTVFGARKVGEKKYENVQLSPKRENKLAELIEAYRTHLHDMGDSHICDQHSHFYAQIAQEARLATRQNWIDIIRQPENDHVLSLIANALGSVGSAESIDVAQKILFVEAPDHFDDFLFGIVSSPSKNPKWHKQLMYWLESNNSTSEYYWKIANTIATVLRRRCEASPSSVNSCNKGKEAIVNKFIKDVTANGINLQVLQILENLPIFESYSIAKKLICSNESSIVQKSALRVILAANKNLYESQLTQKLIRIFRNTCETKQPTSNSQIAIDILLKCIPDHRNVATLILRTESLTPDDNEKWRYLYSAIEASGQNDELKAEIWHQMRQFKVFRPNYLHRSLSNAASHSHWQEITSDATPGFRLFATSSAQFSGPDDFRRAAFQLELKRGKRIYDLFSLNIDTPNLNRFTSISSMLNNEMMEDDDGSTQAIVRFGIIGHKFPPYNVFPNGGDIFTTVWNADGRTIKVFEGHVPLRDARLALPLLSGLTVDISTSASLSTRIHSSNQVLLWNQKTSSKLDVFTSASLLVSASLNLNLSPIHRIDSSISISTSHSTNIDVMFDATPFDFCLKSAQSQIELSQTTIIEKLEKPTKRKTIRRSQSSPGFSYRLNDIISDKCNLYLKNSLKK